MSNETLEEEFAKISTKYEGVVPHLYQDSKGKITVGKGHLVTSIDEAKTLPFYLSSHPDQRATPAQIEHEFRGMQSLLPGKLPGYYKESASLYIKSHDILSIEHKDIHEKITSLHHAFPNFPNYPREAKLALLDMSYNLGTTGLIEKFPRMTAAVRQQDWLTARQECHRANIQEERNRFVAGLFNKAHAHQSGQAMGGFGISHPIVHVQPNPRVIGELVRYTYLSRRSELQVPEGWEIFTSSEEIIHHSATETALHVLATDDLFPPHKTEVYNIGFVGLGFRNKITGECVLASAGTDLGCFSNYTNISNLASDIVLGLFKSVPLAQHAAEKFYLKAKAEWHSRYPNVPFDPLLAGHSLSGVTSTLNGIKFNHRVVTFESPGIRELLPREMQDKSFNNVTNYVMYDNAINLTNTRVGETFRLKPCDSDDQELSKKWIGGWLLKCHSLDTCISAFDSSGKPLKTPTYVKVIIEKVTPQLTYYGSRITPELMHSLQRMYSYGKVDEKDIRIYTQDEIDTVAWNNFGSFRFRHEEVQLQTEHSFEVSVVREAKEITQGVNNQVFINTTKEEVASSDSHTLIVNIHNATSASNDVSTRPSHSISILPTRDHTEPTVFNFDFTLFERPMHSRQRGLFGMSWDNQNGVSWDRSRQGINVNVSALAMTSGGAIAFAPAVGASVAFDLTPTLAAAGVGAGAAIGLTIWGISKLIDHYKYESLPPAKKAIEDLKASISYLDKVEHNAWTCYFNPENWGDSPKELLRESKHEVMKYARKIISTHPDDKSMQHLGRSIIYVIKTNNSQVIDKLFQSDFSPAIKAYSDFVNTSHTQIFELEKGNKFGDCLNLSKDLLIYDDKDPVACFGLALAHESANPKLATQWMQKAINNSSTTEVKDFFQSRGFDQLVRITDSSSSENRAANVKQLRDFALNRANTSSNNPQALTDLAFTASHTEELANDIALHQKIFQLTQSYLSVTPNEFNIRLINCESCIKLGKNSEAKSALEDIIGSKAPDDIKARAHLQAGYVARIEQNPSAVITHLESAKSLGIDQASVHYELAVTYYNQRQYQSSYKSFKDYLTFNPDDFQARVHCGFASLYANPNKTTALEDVISEFSEVIKSCKDKQILSQAQTGLGEAYSRDKSTFNKSIQELTNATENNPNNFHAWRLMGNLYANKTDKNSLRKALACYEECKRNAPDSMLVVDSALVSYRAGDKEIAKKELQLLIDKPIDAKDEASLIAQASASKALSYIESCETTKRNFMLADVASFALLKIAHKISANKDAHPWLQKAAEGYTIIYPLMKDVGFMIARSQASESLSQQFRNIYSNNSTETSHVPDQAVSFRDRVSSLATARNLAFLTHKVAQGVQLARRYSPKTVPWIIGKSAEFFEEGYELFGVGECFWNSYFADPEKISTLFGADVNTLMGIGLAARYTKRWWDTSLYRRWDEYQQISENKLGYVLYDAVNLVGNDYTVFSLQLLAGNPDLVVTLTDAAAKVYEVGGDAAAYVWSLGPAGQVVVVVGATAAVCYAGYKIYEHYQNVDIDTKLQNAETFVLQNKFDEALSKVKEAIAISPNDPKLHKAYDITLCQQRLYEKNHKAVLRITNDHLTKFPNDIDMLRLRGIANLCEGSPESFASAEADFTRVVSMKPDDYSSRISLANALRVQGKPESASQQYSLALEDIERKLNSLPSHSDGNRVKKFIEELKSRIEHVKESKINSLLEHARQLIQNKNVDHGFKVYEFLQELAPHNHRIGDEYLEAKCVHHLQKQEVQHVIDLTDESKNQRTLPPDVLRLRGRALLGKACTSENGRETTLKAAEEVFNRLLIINKNDHEAHEQLALALRYQCQERLAVFHYRQAAIILKQRIDELSSSNQSPESERLMTYLKDQLKQANEAQEETHAWMMTLVNSLKNDISGKSAEMRQKLESNDKIFKELESASEQFRNFAAEEFQNTKNNALNRIRENKFKLYDETRGEIRKVAIDEFDKLQANLKPLLESAQKRHDEFESHVISMEENLNNSLHKDTKSDDTSIVDSTLDKLSPRITSELMDELKQFLATTNQTNESDVSSRVNSYKEVLRKNQRIISKARTYLADAKAAFEAEIDKMLDDMIESNIHDLWRNAIAEFIGTTISQLMQGLCDAWTDTYFRPSIIGKLPIPRWDEFKCRYPLITQLPQEAGWVKSSSSFSLKEAKALIFFPQERDINTPLQYTDKLVLRESASFDLNTLPEAISSSLPRETQFGFPTF